MQDLIDKIYPFILAAGGVAVPMILFYVAYIIKQRTGIDLVAIKKAIESNDRDALHKAAETAAKVAVSKGYIGQTAADFILGYILDSTPEAFDNLLRDKDGEVNRKVLNDIIESKMVDQVAKQKVAEVSEVVGVIKDAATQVAAEQATGQTSMNTIKEFNDKLKQVEARLR